MSTADHPIAHRLRDSVGGDAKLLATVMALPLVDGIFPALVVAGALDDPLGAIQVGLLVFGGSATLVVVLAEMDGPRRERIRVVGLVGVPLVVVAGLQAALAPTMASLLDLIVFERFAALVIAAIAAKTASARIGELLPRPAVIVGLGLLASLDPSGAAVTVVSDESLVVHGVLAAVVGVGFALTAATFAPALRSTLHVDRFRFGSAVALALLPLSMLGLPFGHAPLAVLAITALFAYDPGSRAGKSDHESNEMRASAVTDGGLNDPIDRFVEVAQPVGTGTGAPTSKSTDSTGAEGTDPEPNRPSRAAATGTHRDGGTGPWP